MSHSMTLTGSHIGCCSSLKTALLLRLGTITFVAGEKEHVAEVSPLQIVSLYRSEKVGYQKPDTMSR